MDVIDSSTIDEIFAPFVSEFDTQTNHGSPSYHNMVMDKSPMEHCERNVWDELNSIEPLMLDLHEIDANSTTCSAMDYDQFFPESLGPKMTAIYDPLHETSSPHLKEGSAYSPRREEYRNRMAPPSKMGRNAGKPSRVVRTKLPVFPESSTPLSELKSFSSTCSLSSKSSTVMSDGSYPGTFASDPGHCDVSDATCVNPVEDNQIQQFIAEVLKPRKKLYLEQDDESEKSVSLSPVALCESPVPPMPSSVSKSALKIEMPSRYVKKITDLDRKILKLQAERAKLLEKGQSKVGDDLESSFEGRRGSIDTKSSVQVQYYAVGIPQLDGACYNEGNFLLGSIGGINNDFRMAIESLCEKCNEKKSSENISNCLLYMKTLLVGHQSLRLHQMDDSLYQLLVQPDNPQMICRDLSEALAAANELLKITQQIVGSSTIVENRLKLVIETVQQLVQSCEATCDHLGIVDEQRAQIKNVLEGNQIALETALRLWPKSSLAAKNTLQAITNSMHPIYNRTS